MSISRSSRRASPARSGQRRPRVLETPAKKLEELYRARTPNSARLYAEALKVLPGGVTHSNRYWAPYPLHIDHASGSRIIDVDGNEYIDYWVANGTMFMGHANLQIVA